MKVYEEKPLSRFDFWSGAATNVADFELTEDQFDEIEQQLEVLYPDGMEDTQINDLFWFDFKWVLELIGLTDEDGVEEWWKDLSDEEKREYANLDIEDYIPDDDDERLTNPDDEEEKMDWASDDCTEAAEDWWEDLEFQDKLDCWKENH